MSNQNNQQQKNSGSLVVDLIKLGVTVVGAVATGFAAHKGNEAISRKKAMDAAVRDNNKED